MSRELNFTRRWERIGVLTDQTSPRSEAPQQAGRATTSLFRDVLNIAVRADNQKNTVKLLPKRRPREEKDTKGEARKQERASKPAEKGGYDQNGFLFRDAAEPCMSVQVVTMAGDSGGPSVDSLLRLINNDVDDTERIQAPLLCAVAKVSFDQDKILTNSFSSCLKSSGKTLFSEKYSPREASNYLKSIIISYKNQFYEIFGPAALLFFTRLLEIDDIEIITFFSSFLITPLLSYSDGALFTNRISDIRTMAWLLDPSSSCVDYDVFCRAYGLPPAAQGVDTQDGILERLRTMGIAYRRLYGQLGTRGLLQTFLRQEKLLGWLCCLMYYNGFVVDSSATESYKGLVLNQMATLKSSALEHVPEPLRDGFNIQSSDHLREVLYSYYDFSRYLKDGTVAAQTTGGKLSTSEEVLKVLAPHHPLPAIILEYRSVAKLYQTYFNSVLAPSNLFPFPHNGVNLVAVHANFLNCSTETGRLACCDPNLQNLPRCCALSLDSEVTSSVRRSFVARPGHIIVAIDYEQIELRMLAHMSRDPSLLQALSSSDPQVADIHRAIAAAVYSKTPAEVTSDERSEAKRVVFGVLYGMGAKSLASQAGCSIEHTNKIYQEFHRVFPQVERYRCSVVAQCRKEHQVRTLSGRFRILNDINSINPGLRAQAERQSFNTVIQGSAADVVKRAMAHVHVNVIQKYSSLIDHPLMLCQIHDELIFSCPKTILKDFIADAEEAMLNCILLSLPLRIKTKIGPSLGQLQDWPSDLLIE